MVFDCLRQYEKVSRLGLWRTHFACGRPAELKARNAAGIGLARMEGCSANYFSCTLSPCRADTTAFLPPAAPVADWERYEKPA